MYKNDLHIGEFLLLLLRRQQRANNIFVVRNFVRTATETYYRNICSTGGTFLENAYLFEA